MTTRPANPVSRPEPRVRRLARSVQQVLAGGSLALGTLLASPVLRRWYNRWGATEDEVNAPMPGDDLVNDPKLGYTRGITIAAPPISVWPWLAQFGQGRGGFYSYDALENVIGCRIHSTDQVLQEHQNPAPGDLIRSGPEGKSYAAWEIISVAAPNHLVMMGAEPATRKAPPIVDQIPDKGYAASTWQWLLRSANGGDSTRVVVRQRLTYSRRQWLLWRIVEPLNFVMERRMLLGVKDRAERRSEPTTRNKRNG